MCTLANPWFCHLCFLLAAIMTSAVSTQIKWLMWNRSHCQSNRAVEFRYGIMTFALWAKMTKKCWTHWKQILNKRRNEWHGLRCWLLTLLLLLSLSVRAAEYEMRHRPTATTAATNTVGVNLVGWLAGQFRMKRWPHGCGSVTSFCVDARCFYFGRAIRGQILRPSHLKYNKQYCYWEKMLANGNVFDTCGVVFSTHLNMPFQ